MTPMWCQINPSHARGNYSCHASINQLTQVQQLGRTCVAKKRFMYLRNLQGWYYVDTVNTTAV